MRKISNRTKDKLTVTAILLIVAVFMMLAILAISKAFAENIVEVYDTDVYTYTTIEHDKYLEVRTYDKVAKQYLESSYIGKNYGEE